MTKLTTVFDMRRFIYKHDVTIEKRDQFGASNGSVDKHGYGYLAFVDWNLSPHAALKSARHELIHVLLGHPDDDIKTRDQKEAEVNEFIRKHPDEFNPKEVYDDLFTDITMAYMVPGDFMKKPKRKKLDPLIEFFKNPNARVFNPKGE